MALNLNPFISVSIEVANISKGFQRKIFTIKDCKLTYRALNHYQEIGIIDFIKNNEKSWRKFNGIELIWINIVLQLRGLGISLNKILKAKKSLFEEGNKGSIDKAQFINNSFEQEVALSIFNQYDLYLILFSDFTYTFHDSQSHKQWFLKPYKVEANISIPLTPIIKDILTKINKI
jgi:DNA-binding transcriptional MerR regulator